jgi:hypothetical protein
MLGVKVMTADEMVEILKTFKWDVLRSMFGCAHNSIVGFLSTMWISQSEHNSVLDGAPSPITGRGRTGQKNADILFCKGDKPCIAVEVETTVNRYKDKLKSVQAYLENIHGLEFGLIVMTNLCRGATKYKHNWNGIKTEIRKREQDNAANIALVSIEKRKSELDKKSALGKLRGRNDYYPWEIARIDYWVHDKDGVTREGSITAK